MVLEPEVFHSCFALTSISLPDSMLEIGEKAFYRCISISSVRMPGYLERIGKHSFAECHALHSVSLPVTLKRIEDYAFAGCRGLHTMLFPDHRTSVGNAVLSDCTSLDVLVIQHLPLGYRRLLEKWDVPRRAQIILYSDLRLAFLFAELIEPGTTKDRKIELKREIEGALERMRKRNRLKTVDSIRENLRRVTQAMETMDDEPEDLVLEEEILNEMLRSEQKKQ